VEEGAAQADRSLPPAAVFERDMAWLEECDIFIAEVSGSSFGIGYEAAYALTALDKPAVLFFRQELAGRISLLITGNTHPRCRLAPYRAVEDALDALKRELAA
jgi:nucleoside 2-deoxyribosyltransferase